VLPFRFEKLPHGGRGAGRYGGGRHYSALIILADGLLQRWGDSCGGCVGRWERSEASLPEDEEWGSITSGTARTGGQSLLILSLDTTTRAGSVAVVRDDIVLAEISGDPAVTHGQRLPGELMRALGAARTPLADVDLLAVAAGPGSFTGLRVGIATMQGLAIARGLSIVPVSTLEALASEAAHAAGGRSLIAPWIDAQRGEVFAALYGPHLEAVLVAPSSASPLGTLTSWRAPLGSTEVVFAGSGALRYRAIIESVLGGQARIQEPVPPLAATIGRIAAREPDRAVVPHAVVPVYVRRSDAELARERSASR